MVPSILTIQNSNIISGLLMGLKLINLSNDKFFKINQLALLNRILIGKHLSCYLLRILSCENYSDFNVFVVNSCFSYSQGNLLLFLLDIRIFSRTIKYINGLELKQLSFEVERLSYLKKSQVIKIIN